MGNREIYDCFNWDFRIMHPDRCALLSPTLYDEQQNGLYCNKLTSYEKLSKLKV